MANRIDSVQNTIIQKTGRDTVSNRTGSVSRSDDSASAAAAKKAPGAKDSVTLTEQGRRLEQLEAELAALPVIDRAKVDAVKADIESGNYTIDVEKIADLLLATDGEFDD